MLNFILKCDFKVNCKGCKTPNFLCMPPNLSSDLCFKEAWPSQQVPVLPPTYETLIKYYWGILLIFHWLGKVVFD